jgi:hypothetical protein
VGQIPITSVICVLCFESLLGLKINLAKSKLVLVCNVNNVDGLTRILECKVSYLPMKYLGLPLGASFKAKSIWNGVIEKIEHWLVGWLEAIVFV